MADSLDKVKEGHGVIYDVQTRWKDLHLPTFIGASSALYFVEQLVGHPLEVIRTRLQVESKVCVFLCYIVSDYLAVQIFQLEILFYIYYCYRC